MKPGKYIIIVNLDTMLLFLSFNGKILLKYFFFVISWLYFKIPLTYITLSKGGTDKKLNILMLLIPDIAITKFQKAIFFGLPTSVLLERHLILACQTTSYYLQFRSFWMPGVRKIQQLLKQWSCLRLHREIIFSSLEKKSLSRLGVPVLVKNMPHPSAAWGLEN